MLTFGITGGIGSGKTFVAERIASRGIPIYNTDQAARRILCTDGEVRRELEALLGSDLYVDGAPDKLRLAAYLFADPHHRAEVNAIVHPRVRTDFRRWLAGLSVPLAGMECAILYEAGFDTEVDRVLVVTAPKAVRIARVGQRDGLAPAEVRRRMRAQWTEEQLLARADFVLVNDGTATLDGQIDEFMASLCGAGR